MFIGLGSSFWNNAIYISTKSKLVSEAEFLPFYIKVLPLFFSFSGIFLIFFLDSFIFSKFFSSRLFYYSYSFFNNRWFFDHLFNYYLNSFILKWSLFFFIKELDKGIIELLGPKGLVSFFFFIISNIKQKYIGRFYINKVLIFFNFFFITGLIYLHVTFI